MQRPPNGAAAHPNPTAAPISGIAVSGQPGVVMKNNTINGVFRPDLNMNVPIRNIVQPHKDCSVDVQDDGSAEVFFVIEPVIMKRIISRANGMDLGQYLWENVFKRALSSHVY